MRIPEVWLEYPLPHCPECGKQCGAMFTFKASGVVLCCDCGINTQYSDDEGFEEFACPAGCTLVPGISQEVYTWHGSGQAAGCRHCLSRYEPDERCYPRWKEPGI